LLNILAHFIPEQERILVIEDTAEIQISVLNLVRLESRVAQNDFPAVIIRELLKASLRHRPDRILLGEIRGAEAFDLLQLLNTGHSGTISTVHANSAPQALSSIALSTLCLMAAGTMHVASLRAYLWTFSSMLVVTMLAVDPRLARERAHPRQDAVAPHLRFGAAGLFLLTLTTAAFAVGRLRIFAVPPQLRLIALLLFVLSSALQTWAMIWNTFFSPALRIQSEADILISTGPYRFVRTSRLFGHMRLHSRQRDRYLLMARIASGYGICDRHPPSGRNRRSVLGGLIWRAMWSTHNGCVLGCCWVKDAPHCRLRKRGRYHE